MRLTTSPGLGDGRRLTRLTTSLGRLVDIRWLAAFRILYGISMAVSLLRLIGYGWVEELFVRPNFHFKYWGFAWVTPLPGPSLIALAWLLLGFSGLVAAGLCFRIAAVAFVTGFTYLQLIDVTTYLNHYYLASLLGLLLASSPAHRAWSLDAALRPRLRASEIPTFWLYLFRFQVGLVYTFAGVAKAHSDWLFRAQPLEIWLASRTDLPWIGPLFALPGVPLAMSWAGFLFDSTIAGWLLWKRTRFLAFCAVLAFHTMTKLLFPIGMFPFIMVGAALVFFAPDWPVTLLRKARGLFARHASLPHVREEGTRTLDGASRVVRVRPAMLLLVGAYCAVQIGLPLRFLSYGGNVRWHEQGMRFSWRVMVREKNGSVTYVVRNPSTNRTWHVSPHRYLTPLQEREISGQPDLILQLAHHIQRDFEARELGPVEVRVDALVSLNGRRATRLVDPNAELTRIRDGLTKYEWVLPAPVEAPSRIRAIGGPAVANWR